MVSSGLQHWRCYCALGIIVNLHRAGAERFAAVFAPKTEWSLCLRNQVIKAFAVPGLARLAVGRDIIDTLRLPDSGPSARPSHPPCSDAPSRVASAGPWHWSARPTAANDHPAPWQWPECAAPAWRQPARRLRPQLRNTQILALNLDC
jgi:hypothetical protein